jgi:hypothetical protein
MKPKPNLPFRPPETTCNARLARQGGYCENVAGAETDHIGIGRCRLHGGATPKQDLPDGPLDLFKSLGLGKIIETAEVMTKSDQEYLFDVSNNALVVTRAGIVARMQAIEVAPRELADLSMALSRIDLILAKYTNEENPDKAPNIADASFEAEVARLNALEGIQ